MMPYLYMDITECIAGDQHLLSTDEDGYCNNCGHPNTYNEEYYDDDDLWVEFYDCPGCQQNLHLDIVERHIYEGCDS